MKNVYFEDEIAMVLRDSLDPFRMPRACLVKIRPRRNSRRVATRAGTVRVAFAQRQLLILAGAMRRFTRRVRALAKGNQR